MAELILRSIEEEVVELLRKRASQHGISEEEEHRRILRAALLEPESRRIDGLKSILLAMPDVGEDNDFERRRDFPTQLDLG